MKKNMLFIMILFVSIIVVGCGKKETKYEKHLISFSYSYGNVENGLSDYSITLNEENKAIYIVSSSTNEIPYTEKEVDKENFGKINKIINDYDVLDWDGFNKIDNEDDEICFSIQIGYDDGSNYNASGCGKYPKNFEEAHKALINILNQINY